MLSSLRGAVRPRCRGERFFSGLAAFDASKLTVHACAEPKPKPERDELVFGRSMSDHMLLCDWTAAEGWGAPRIVPHEPLAVSPACLGLHLGISCFEGMKAYRDTHSGAVRLFRPDMNAQRFQRSCSRVALPTADAAELTEAICALVRQDADWVPEGDGFSLYIRPVCFATEAYHGVGAPSAATIVVTMSAAAPYFGKAGFSGGIRLKAESTAVRAWPGGGGGHKLAGNYAPTIAPQRRAQAEGFNDVLWLFGGEEEEQLVTEAGSSNFFALIAPAAAAGGGAKPQLVTAPISRGDILPGVTRDSILALARTEEVVAGQVEVVERTLSIAELAEAAEEGRLLEAFSCGTAAVISPVQSVTLDGVESSASESPGPVSRRLYERLLDIQYGRAAGPPGWSVVC